MGTIITRAVGLFLIILLAYFLKQIGFLNKADGSSLSIVIMNVTLPAVVIINLANLDIKGNLLLFVLLGLLWSFLQIFLSYFAAKKKTTTDQQFFIYCASGFNIGNFTLPFVQGFLPLGVPLLSMFDIGNSIMLAGGTKVVSDRLTGQNTGVHFKSILRQLFSSIPFTCYVVMLGLRLISIDLPASFLTVLEPVADANVFLSMFMIGLYLELRLPKPDRNTVLQLLTLRYAMGLLFVLFFYLLPIASLTKIILCLLCVTPVPLFGVVNSVIAGIKEESVGFASSVSFLVSLPLMTLLLLLLGSSV
ncbi:AEC family transporter [Tetragenococcus koreensis]|uniref:Permease n=1 Tax=Tetragenococcus koreensis TaxID=290335 RepID=A0AAN4RLX2_9ENTE|nr:transporter [Tetragenococcus koreensis]AYW45344.1 transporter [Tetragenococcus koreensis]MCF1617052.1 transporter [Tetragenococcus koreensis]MCF1621911.1 transporter [Tetragenococcus koreensis]MCF1626595.1 transporter [Tetragenococcus koreensis]MCF1631557.1 transporter [Tetragenococcus koreensis]